MNLRALCLTALISATPFTALAQTDSGSGKGPVQGESGIRADSGFSTPSAASYLKPEEAAGFAKQVERELATKGARVALVFRTGRPRSKLPKGISYTHGAFWVYTTIKTGDGRTINGYAVYNLYHGDGQSLPVDQSYLHQDFPYDFVAATAVDDVAVIIPSPEMQRRIYETIASPRYEALHVKSYSLVANPLNAAHQNCNEFMLDVIASAVWQTDDYTQIKANLAAHFKPTMVHTNVFERLLAPVADKTLALDDQNGQIVTATYESMSAFMKTEGLLQESYVLNRAK